MTNSTRPRRNYQVRCPECHAGIGHPCISRQTSERLPGVHFQRKLALRSAVIEAYRFLYAPLPQVPK